MKKECEWALQRAGIWKEVKDKLKQNGNSLSGGQQQRLCIARAIAVKPEVLLLDEPTSALDPISTASIEELISEFKREYTIAIVTHNMQQAGRVSDFTAFMYLGSLVEFNETAKIFTKPTEKLNRAVHHRSLRMTVEERGLMERYFDQEFKGLKTQILAMGNKVSEAINSFHSRPDRT